MKSKDIYKLYMYTQQVILVPSVALSDYTCNESEQRASRQHVTDRSCGDGGGGVFLSGTHSSGGGLQSRQAVELPSCRAPGAGRRGGWEEGAVQSIRAPRPTSSEPPVPAPCRVNARPPPPPPPPCNQCSSGRPFCRCCTRGSRRQA